MFLNLKTANGLSITVPLPLLGRANEDRIELPLLRCMRPVVADSVAKVF
jgi:hypothetical protein